MPWWRANIFEGCMKWKVDALGWMLLGSASQPVNKLRGKEKNKNGIFFILFFLNKGITLSSFIYLQWTTYMSLPLTGAGRKCTHDSILHQAVTKNKKRELGILDAVFAPRMAAVLVLHVCSAAPGSAQLFLNQGALAVAPPSAPPAPPRTLTSQHDSQVTVCWTVLQVLYDIL